MKQSEHSAHIKSRKQVKKLKKTAVLDETINNLVEQRFTNFLHETRNTP